MKSPRMPSCWPISDWPSADQKAWTCAAESDPLAREGQGASSHWRVTTRRFVQVGYGNWLGWLDARHGVCLDETPAQRATVARVREYLNELTQAGLADYTRAGRMQALGDALRTMCPETPTAFIGKLAGHLYAEARPLRDLNGRLRPAREILDLGYHLMQSANTDHLPGVRRPIAFRDGLLIALWACRMLRVANLSQIAIDGQLLRTGDRHRVEFSAAEMKQRRPWGCSWPERLEDALAEYISEHRPRLAARGQAGSKVLWLSQFGTPMPPESVAQVIKLRTKAAFGQSISSHLMRHIGATGLAEAYSNSSIDIAAMLGHATTDTAEKHYILGRGAAAVRDYNAVLDTL
ncbi:tyrosine-type recombinase/integrase [Brevundimonas sp.]|uniref:tyrosine-type recombinase/integrase n=1 Tax=Brevundimonas sp. TaxID=1871086 RepID=UPI002488C056|nr:tyrosine-type recombinase/integrase [Brevundimonas sp.]MDI1281524.1 tyrosine-type recombinase/integrase [Brevundimonas sp.]